MLSVLHMPFLLFVKKYPCNKTIFGSNFTLRPHATSFRRSFQALSDLKSESWKCPTSRLLLPWKCVYGRRSPTLPSLRCKCDPYHFSRLVNDWSGVCVSVLEFVVKHAVTALMDLPFLVCVSRLIYTWTNGGQINGASFTQRILFLHFVVFVFFMKRPCVSKCDLNGKLE